MPSELGISYILIWVIVTATAVGDEHYSEYSNEKSLDYGNYPSDYDPSPDYYDEKPEPRPSRDYKDEEDSDKQHYPTVQKLKNSNKNHRESNRKGTGSFDYNSEDNDAILGRTEHSEGPSVPKFRPGNKGSKGRDFDTNEPKRHSSRFDRYNKNDGSGGIDEVNSEDDEKYNLRNKNHNANERISTTVRVIHRKPREKNIRHGTNDNDGLHAPRIPDSFDDYSSPKPRTTPVAKGQRNVFEEAVFSDTARKRKYYKEYEDYYDLKRIQRLKQRLAAQKDARTFAAIEPMFSVRSSIMTTANWLMRTTNLKRMDFVRIKKAGRVTKVTVPNHDNDLFIEYVDNFDLENPYYAVTVKSKQAKMLSRLRNQKGQYQKKQDNNNIKGPKLWSNDETKGMSVNKQSSIIDLEDKTGRQLPYQLQEDKSKHIGRNTSTGYHHDPSDTNTITNISYDTTDTTASWSKEKSGLTLDNDEDDINTIEAWTDDVTKSEQNISLSLRKLDTIEILAKTIKLSRTTISTTRQKNTVRSQAPNRSTPEEQSTMMSFTEKTNLSIQKETQTKEILNVLVTKKPTVLMQMINKSYTNIMIEPSTSKKLQNVQDIYNDVSPEQLLKVKRIMRHKILSNVKSLRDLNENWDEMVCDYIDMSLLNEISAGTVGVANILMLFTFLCLSCNLSSI